MERLALSSNILYNKDILDKEKEIQKIKNRICPKIIYDNYEEFEKLQKEAIKSCEKGITKTVNSIDFQYERFGIFNILQDDYIFNILCDAFNILTKNQVNKWVYEYAGIVNLTIYNILSILSETELWENIYHHLGREGLIIFLTKIVKNTFVNGEYWDDSNNFGEKIRYFKCKKCNNIVHFINKINICYSCEVEALSKRKKK